MHHLRLPALMLAILGASTHVALDGGAAAHAALESRAATGDEPRITLSDLAPPSTFVLIGTDDWTGMSQAWDRSSVSMLTKDPEFVAMWKAIWSSINAPGEEPEPGSLPLSRLFPFKALLEDANVNVEDLPLPTGATGLALFERAPSAEKPTPRNDEDEDMWFDDAPPPGLLLCSDFGARANEVEVFLERAIEQLVRRGEATVTEAAHAGATIRSIDLPKLEERWRASMDEAAKKADEQFRKHAGDEMNEEDLQRFGPGQYMRRRPMPAELRAIATVHVARRESMVLLANERGAVERALDHLDGQRIASIAERPSLIEARRWLGDGAHAYVIALIDVLAERKAAAPEERHTEIMDLLSLGMPESALMLTGLKGTRSLVVGIDLDTERSPVEIRVAMMHPSLGGLFALFDKAPGSFEPPAFAQADCAGAGTMFVRFDRLIPELRARLRTIPEDERPLADEEIAQFEGIAGPVLESLGPQVHFITNIDRPFSAQSSQFLAAIQLRDDAPVRNVLAAFGGAAGLKARDFEGHMIWDLELGPMAPPLSLGMGFGYAFVGQTTGVEGAMRQAARPDTGLAKKPEFRDAVAGLRPGASAYLFQDTRQSFEHLFWTVQHPAEAIGLDLGDNEELAEALKSPSWAKAIPPADRWSKFLGDSVGEVMITPAGIEMISYYRPGTK